MAQTNLTSEVAHQSTASASGTDTLLTPELQLVFLTWVTFILLLWILKKFAWKPILTGLENRENSIRTAVEEAQKTHDEYLKIGDKRKEILLEADKTAKELVEQAKSAANKSAKLIEERAKNEATIVLENVNREIEAEKEKASAYLREKAAQTAVELAEKILQKNLDLNKQKKVIDSLVDEL